MIKKDIIQPINDLIEKRAKELKNKIAYADETEKISYENLNIETKRLSFYLNEKKLNYGDAASIILPNSVNWIVSCFAIIRLGCLVVPISYDSTLSEIEYKLNDSNTKILITTNEIKDKIKKQLELKNEIQFITVDDQKADLNLTKIRKINHQSILLKDDINKPSYILYTSGTTGQPKGVLLTTRGMLWVIASCWMPIAGLNENSKVLSPLPLFHSYALNLSVLGILAAGASEFLLPKFSPIDIFNKTNKEEFNFLPGVPTMFHYLLSTGKKDNLNLNNINKCVSAGAIMPAKLNYDFEEYFNLELLDGYGITETSTMVTMNWSGKERNMGSCGLPLPGMSVRIVNDNDLDVKPGEEGELICRGPNVMIGYHKKENETDKILKNGWYYTGDLAKQDLNGFITITGRLKEIIIRGGQNISPTEVEEAILKNSKILDCAVVGLKHSELGEIPAAFVILKEGEIFNENEIKNFCTNELSKYKIPDIVKKIDFIPRTGSGKTMRYKLIQNYEEKSI